MARGNLIVISGPSGAGKGTLVARLMSRVPGLWLSVSCTTRQPRPGEVDGVQYRFMDVADFERGIEAGDFLEWARVHDNYYGTSKVLVEEHMDAGEQVILEIDVQGALAVREIMPEAHLVFVAPPSLEVLEERLRGRGTEDEATIAKRMRNAEVELSHKMDYDVVLVNDGLDECTDELCALVEAFADA